LSVRSEPTHWSGLKTMFSPAILLWAGTFRWSLAQQPMAKR